MELSELEQVKGDLPLANLPNDDDDYEEQALTDVIEGISLLATSKTLLEYLSNPTLCTGVSKRERETMGRLAEKIREYLCEVEPTYIGET